MKPSEPESAKLTSDSAKLPPEYVPFSVASPSCDVQVVCDRLPAPLAEKECPDESRPHAELLPPDVCVCVAASDVVPVRL